jgi:two-component system cell cycle response regulator
VVFVQQGRFQISAKPKILLIDNAMMMHGAVRARLAEDGLEFHSAFDGEKGLSLAQSIRPDVILLDVHMPSPNGFEVCRRLKEDPATSNIPVIFLTGMSSTSDKIRGLNLGAMDYVTKPFDAYELQARVRASLRHKELLDLLSKKAMIDGLTGLRNRSFLNQVLKEELAYAKRHGRPLSCIMLDVDHFKMINDTYGHGFGDKVLKGVAGMLQEVTRSEDVAYRYGGEEFVVFARETDASAAMLVAERLRAGVEAAKFSLDKAVISVTCSLGVADSCDEGDDLMIRADRALYESKQNGRNRATIFKPRAAA